MALFFEEGINCIKLNLGNKENSNLLILQGALKLLKEGIDIKMIPLSDNDIISKFGNYCLEQAEKDGNYEYWLGDYFINEAIFTDIRPTHHADDTVTFVNVTVGAVVSTSVSAVASCAGVLSSIVCSTFTSSCFPVSSTVEASTRAFS